MQPSSALNAYMAHHSGATQQEGNPWGGLTPSLQGGEMQGGGHGLHARSPAVVPPVQNPYSASQDTYNQDYNTLVRPSAQYRQTEDSRRSYEDQGAQSAAAWQRDNRATPNASGMWNASESHAGAYNFGNDAGLSSWQQQLSQLQHSSAMDQRSVSQHQGWAFPGSAVLQQQQQQQQQRQLQQPHAQQIVRKPSSGDQLVQDLRAQWGSMASPPHQQHAVNSQLPQALAAPSSGSGFENMWGPATAPGLPSQAVPPPQAAANPNSRFTEDAATLLDFPDWDGPGLAGALPLDDMIMNSIGQSAPPSNAPADSLLPQGSDAGTQRPASEKQAAQKGASKKKQKPGKKAAKGAATASGGQPESPAVEFLVANEAYQEQGGIVMQGVKTPPVTVLMDEPSNVLLPVIAYTNSKKPLPSEDASYKILRWTFAQHLPSSWVL